MLSGNIMATFTLFTDMGEKINEIVDAAIKVVQTGWVAGLIDVTNFSFSIYVMFYGYCVLAGKIQDPMSDFIWNLARFAIVMGILGNIGTYSQAVTDMVHGIRGFLIGDSDVSSSAYSGIDARVGSVINLYVNSWEDAKGISGCLFWIVQALFMVPMCLGVISYSVGIIASEISLIALLAVFPIFLSCYLWGWLKNMFSMWIQAIIGCCLFVLFLSIFSKVGFAIAEYTNDWVAKHSGAEVFISCLMYMIAGTITIAGAKLAGQLSMALSQVSVDRMGYGNSSQSQKSQNESLKKIISMALLKKM